MADEDDARLLRFTMSGQVYELDASADKLMGDEVVLLEQVTGGTTGDWVARIEAHSPTGRDILLLAYLAKHRTNTNLDWSQFIRTVAPYTLGLVEDEPAAAPKSKPANGSRARKPADVTSS